MDFNVGCAEKTEVRKKSGTIHKMTKMVFILLLFVFVEPITCLDRQEKKNWKILLTRPLVIVV